MSNVLVLLTYKLKMFFGPTYRGRFGPLPLIGVILMFVPTGLGMGYAIGGYVDVLGADMAIATLGMVFGAGLAFGFIFALGVGVAASPSELDFLMTAPVKPREYLVADMLFEFTTMLLTGGLAMFLAVFGFLLGMGRPVWLAVPLFVIFGLFMFFVFAIIQSVTVLKITRPAGRVRTIALVLLLLSLLPVAALAAPSLSATVRALPIPQSVFGTVVYDIVFETSVSFVDVAVLAAYVMAVGAVWFSCSNSYFFHGVKPTLSAGLGQIDMSSKMAQQRRLIGVFGRSTGTLYLNVLKGGDLSFMTRLNLVRVWRDGSFVFIWFLVAIWLFVGLAQTSSGDTTGMSINLLQAGTWPIAIIALNWCYYERGNLWIAVVGGKSLVTYFKGLMFSLLIIGFVITAVVLGVMTAAGHSLGMRDVAFMIASLVGDSVVATMLLTRIRVNPGAFSPGLLVVLFVTLISGAVFGFSASFLVGILGGTSTLMMAVQVAATVVFAAAVALVGMLAMDRLARGFEFS
jgi:hypothetical protein